jgi:hypothetical protein
MLRFVFVSSVLLLVFCINSLAQDPGLVGLWLFDEGAGDTVKDSTEHENHGEMVGKPK